MYYKLIFKKRNESFLSSYIPKNINDRVSSLLPMLRWAGTALDYKVIYLGLFFCKKWEILLSFIIHH